MVKKLNSLLAILLAFFLVMTGVNNSHAVGEEVFDDFDGVIGTMIVANAETGEVYYEKNSDDLVGIASMSKLMTYLIVKDEISEGKYKLTDPVTITFDSAKHAVPGNAKMDLTVGEVISVEDLLKGLMIVSGNDAAAALAINSAGSEDEFAKKMNAKAEELGLQSYEFVNASGLTDEIVKKADGTIIEKANDEEVDTARDAAAQSTDTIISQKYNKMSARSLMMLTKQIVTKYPEVLEYHNMEQLVMPERDFVGNQTHNMYKSIPGLMGLKTGFTEEAKFNFTGYVDMNGHEKGQKFKLITVVTGADNYGIREKCTKELINYVSKNYFYGDVTGYYDKNPVTYYQSGQTKQTRFPLFLEKPIEGIFPRGAKVEMNYEIEKGIKAPYNEGQVLGKATFWYDGKELGKVNLINKSQLEKMNFGQTFIESAKDFVKKLMLII